MAYRRSFAPYSGSWRKAYDRAKALKVERQPQTLESIFGKLCFHCQKPPMNCDCMPCDCVHCAKNIPPKPLQHDTTPEGGRK